MNIVQPLQCMTRERCNNNAKKRTFWQYKIDVFHKKMFRYYTRHEPTNAEKKAAAEYTRRVDVFEKLKEKYTKDKIETLEDLKDFLEKHIYSVPLTFFTVYEYLKYVEDPKMMEEKPLDWMDFDKSVQYITKAVTANLVSDDLKSTLQAMYTFVQKNSNKSSIGNHIYTTLSNYMELIQRI